METDILIIGAGPAGLSAGITAASEGINAVVVGDTIGGQILGTKLLENYPGRRLTTGQEFIDEMVVQLGAFGGRLISARITALHRDVSDAFPFMAFHNGGSINARAVILATGQEFNALDGIEGEVLCETGYTGDGGQRAYVIGAGNSAAQAALCLAESGTDVTILCRDSHVVMSRYLIDRLDARKDRIHVVYNASVTAIRDVHDKREIEYTVNGVRFLDLCDRVTVYIGARPRTDWLKPLGILLDDNGFIMRVGEVTAAARYPTDSLGSFTGAAHGIFVAGDVRSGALKRVTTAVGSGVEAFVAARKYVESLGVMNASTLNPNA